VIGGVPQIVMAMKFQQFFPVFQIVRFLGLPFYLPAFYF
jgi:hypothetical protein